MSKRQTDNIKKAHQMVFGAFVVVAFPLGEKYSHHHARFKSPLLGLSFYPRSPENYSQSLKFLRKNYGGSIDVLEIRKLWDWIRQTNQWTFELCMVVGVFPAHMSKMILFHPTGARLRALRLKWQSLATWLGLLKVIFRKGFSVWHKTDDSRQPTPLKVPY